MVGATATNKRKWKSVYVLNDLKLTSHRDIFILKYFAQALRIRKGEAPPEVKIPWGPQAPISKYLFVN